MLKGWLSYGLVITGSCLSAAAFGLIVLPQDFVAGGVTGLSVLLCGAIPLSVSAMVLLLNLILFVLGWFFVGRDFVVKTLLTSILFPVMLEVFQGVSAPFSELAADPLLSSLLAGGLLGLGAGLILRGNGSGGGFDILGVILHQKFRISVSLVMYLCDFFVIIMQAISNSLLKTAYGILVILVSSLVVNQVLTHGKAEGQLLIFSQEYEKIRTELLSYQDVGMTFLSGETGYRRDPIKVIITVVPHDKIEHIKRGVYKIDPTAFVLMDSVRYVGGRGYTISR